MRFSVVVLAIERLWNVIRAPVRLPEFDLIQ